MDQGLKERLVGAAVLVAIAVWLIPWVLDGPEAGIDAPVSSLQLPAAEEPMPIRTQTLRLGDAPEAAPPPAASPAPEVKAAEPVPAEGEPGAEAETTVAALRPEPAAPAPQAARTATPPPKPSAPVAEATGDWTVQLGSFSSEANARRQAERAGTFGYKAEVSSVRGKDGKTLYRVRVGPQATRGAAEAAASALRAHGIKEASVAAR
jgi:DedD protein